MIYFHIQGSFSTTFCTSFWKRVHNLKKIVNLQGLLVLTVGYVDVKTYPLTKYYLKDYISFIGCLHYLIVHFRSCCFYIQYHGGR